MQRASRRLIDTWRVGDDIVGQIFFDLGQLPAFVFKLSRKGEGFAVASAIGGEPALRIRQTLAIPEPLEVDQRYVQKQLGHTSAKMTRKYQRRRDRFRVKLTKAAGL